MTPVPDEKNEREDDSIFVPSADNEDPLSRQAQFHAMLDQRSREMDEDPAMSIPWDDIKLALFNQS